jgi:hypothetical protein
MCSSFYLRKKNTIIVLIIKKNGSDKMGKKIGLLLLEKVQCMYQQKIISRQDKNEIAGLIKEALKTGRFSDVSLKLKVTECQIPKKEYWIEDTIKIIEGGN